MSKKILEQLKVEKKKYVKKLDSKFNDFDEYIDSKYSKQEADFYSNVLNQLIIFKLIKNYDGIPDQIIDFLKSMILII